MKNKSKNNCNALVILKNHLERMAAADKSFADKYFNKGKSLEDCLEYIKSEARKQACNGSAMIEDSVVFGWAAHYYQEDSIETKKNKIDCKVAISSKDEKKNTECIELDLFGGML